MSTEREKQAEQATLNGLVLVDSGNNNTAGDNTNTGGGTEIAPVGDGSAHEEKEAMKAFLRWFSLIK